MKKIRVCVLLVGLLVGFVFTKPVAAQQGSFSVIGFGVALPPTCDPLSVAYGQQVLFYLTTQSGSNVPGLYACVQNGIWSFSGPSGSGKVSSALAHQPAYYPADGTTVAGFCTVPTTNGMFDLEFNVTADAAVDPNCYQKGFLNSAITGAATTYIIASTDNLNGVEHDAAGSAAVTFTLPTPTTLENPRFALPRLCNNTSSHTDTLTPTTWTVNGGASVSLVPLVCWTVSVDPDTADHPNNWLANSSVSLAYLLATPAFGTPSTLTLTNAIGLPAASVVAGALANGMTATTQAALSADTKVATDAYVDTATAIDPTVSAYVYRTWFCGGIHAEGLLAGAFYTDTGGTGDITETFAPTIHMPGCTITFKSGATASSWAGTYGPLYCNVTTPTTSCGTPSTVNAFPPLGSAVFDSYVIMTPTVLSTSVGTKIQVGFVDFQTAILTNSIYVRYSKVSGDTDYQLVTCAATLCHANDLGIGPVVNRATVIRIFSTVAGTIQYSICNAGSAGAICTPSFVGSTSTDVPTVGMTMTADMENESTASDRELAVSYFSIRIPVQ